MQTRSGCRASESPRREKRAALPFILFGSTFFLAGGAFGYFVAFPLAVRFLLDLGEQETAAALRIRRGTVKSRTSRALARMRTVLGEEAS